MKLYPYPVYKKCNSVKTSYDAHFKELDSVEIQELCHHNSFLEKVHTEMLLLNKTDNDVLSQHLNIYLKDDGYFDNIFKSVYVQKGDLLKEQNSFVNAFFEKK